MKVRGDNGLEALGKVEMAIWRDTTARIAAAVGLLGLLAGGCAKSGEPTGARGGEQPRSATSERALVGEGGKFDFGAMREDATEVEARRAIRNCEDGSAEACYRLGVFYHGGDGVRRNNALSNQLIEHACETGYDRACYDMGTRLYQGIEMDQNLAAARPYFRRTCESGIKEGCHMMGRMVKRGLGGPRNLERARRLFRRACQLGSVVDCQRLESPLRKNPGRHEERLPGSAPEQLVEAARKCDSGLMSGCTQLAEAYELGRGVAQNFQRAQELYRLACDWGKLDACEVFRMMEGTANRFD